MFQKHDFATLMGHLLQSTLHTKTNINLTGTLQLLGGEKQYLFNLKVDPKVEIITHIAHRINTIKTTDFMTSLVLINNRLVLHMVLT